METRERRVHRVARGMGTDQFEAEQLALSPQMVGTGGQMLCCVLPTKIATSRRGERFDEDWCTTGSGCIFRTKE